MLNKTTNRMSNTREKEKKIKFSWETKIEEDVLDFCKHMADEMEWVANHNLEHGWFANNRLQEDAQIMANAYRLVEKHILNEMKFRRLLK